MQIAHCFNLNSSPKPHQLFWAAGPGPISCWPDAWPHRDTVPCKLCEGGSRAALQVSLQQGFMDKLEQPHKV